MGAEKIRESVIAGTWYPNSPDRLRREIEGYLSRARVKPVSGEIMGIISPHAGYMYSGGVAAYAYKILQSQDFKRVLIVAPSHRAYFQGASIYNLGGYRTPLGVVPLDHKIIDSLFKQDVLLRYVPEAHAQEHSLEIQLPFLQVVLGDFSLTPIVMGDQSFEYCNKLAKAISNACRDERVLLVASSDLSHYYPYNEAKRMDGIVMRHVGAFDPEGLSRAFRSGTCEACGGGPILVVMLAARLLGANRAAVLYYANSGDVTGDHSGVVGYMAAVICKNPGSEDDKRKVGVDLGLSEEEKETLRKLAIETIQCRLRNKPLPRISKLTGKLGEPAGAFVTLRKGGALRGCIGSILPQDALYKTVQEMAIQSAFADPRFPPLTAEEIDQIEVEISVLTPMKRITSIDEIEIGKHGIYIRRGPYSGLLLPQVAVENGWDREEFLKWTCFKAGLPENAWKNPETEIYIFSADVF